MVFYVYIDPEIFPLAEKNGKYAFQSLIAILRGFLQNCFISEFIDHRIQDSIKEKISNLSETYDRKIIKSILSAMAKRNRFIYCLTPDYSESKTEKETLFEQAKAELIDLALLDSTPNPDDASPEELQIATLSDYQDTNFEIERSRLACDGLTTVPDTITKKEFLDRCLLKVFRHASKLEVCDKILGKKFGDNYLFTIKEMIKWMKNVFADNNLPELMFHCGKPDNEGRADYMKTELKEIRDKEISDLKMHIQFYNFEKLSDELPHDRFISTDQISLSIGRGMDFLDEKTRMARDVTINIINSEDCQRVLNHYASAKAELINL